ncbi:urease accessory protein [Azoarcus indigens]|uniref:Urease accessory protein UreD n=1 Tax=Azoarcus indigens TaxID=29545 RepID=A0A4R6E6H7_9RHOO|nr:urease accessory protein UreD [Azoarcus indigens]NMG66774.1 urease accessory protein [Azoarcus indigens]TDN53500.1 urease accessory protein [Azoarcus indigens]
MNAVVECPSLTPSAHGWQAELHLGFRRRGDRSVLAERRHVGPLVVQRALYPEGGEVCHAIVVHPPAGIVGGDSLTLNVDVGAGAHALLTTPGAGKWYRSEGRAGRLSQRIAVAEGGVCEWLPQESIVYEGAVGELLTEVELAGDACFIGSEMSCFGRTGSGERFGRGTLALATRIRRDGKSLWLERGRVEGGGSLMDSPVGLGGHPVVGTLLAASPRVDGELLAACRGIAPAVGEGAVTLLPGLLVARYLGPGCEPGRIWFNRLWAVLRPALAGRPLAIPRIWNT